MRTDAAGLDVLTADECSERLARMTVGRVAFTAGGLPTVRPVNFVLDGSNIVVRTGRDTRLATAAHGSMVAFEVDELEPALRRGWSVVAVGIARRVEDAALLARLSELPLTTWAPSARDVLVRIDVILLSGRRVPEQADDVEVVRLPMEDGHGEPWCPRQDSNLRPST